MSKIHVRVHTENNHVERLSIKAKPRGPIRTTMIVSTVDTIEPPTVEYLIDIDPVTNALTMEPSNKKLVKSVYKMISMTNQFLLQVKIILPHFCLIKVMNLRKTFL